MTFTIPLALCFVAFSASCMDSATVEPQHNDHELASMIFDLDMQIIVQSCPTAEQAAACVRKRTLTTDQIVKIATTFATHYQTSPLRMALLVNTQTSLDVANEILKTKPNPEKAWLFHQVIYWASANQEYVPELNNLLLAYQRHFKYERIDQALKLLQRMTLKKFESCWYFDAHSKTMSHGLFVHEPHKMRAPVLLASREFQIPLLNGTPTVESICIKSPSTSGNKILSLGIAQQSTAHIEHATDKPMLLLMYYDLDKGYYKPSIFTMTYPG